MNKMRKIILYFTIVFTFISCATAHINNKRADSIKKIVIKYIDFEIETPFKTDCKDFISAFKNMIQTISISDKEKINELVSVINKLPHATNKMPKPDTRIKIELIYENGEIQDYCIGQFSVTHNGELYIPTDDLGNLLVKMGLITDIQDLCGIH